MQDLAPLPGGWPSASHDAQAQIRALAEQVRHTMAVARGLLTGGRRVDLTGLDRGVGLLCAKALDLPPDQGRAARVELLRLVAELDSLGIAMRATPA